MCKATASEISSEILAYLAKHPHAQDTLRGIIDWWLLEQQIERQTTEVKQALDNLLAKGLILERKGKDSQLHYLINRRKANEIRNLIKRNSG